MVFVAFYASGNRGLCPFWRRPFRPREGEDSSESSDRTSPLDGRPAGSLDLSEMDRVQGCPLPIRPPPQRRASTGAYRILKESERGISFKFNPSPLERNFSVKDSSTSLPRPCFVSPTEEGGSRYKSLRSRRRPLPGRPPDS